MSIVDTNRFSKIKKHKHRAVVKKLNYKLTSDGLKEFQNEFPGVTNLRQIYKKLKDLDETDDSWYTDRISNGKLLKTEKEAPELGEGIALKLKEIGGFKQGKKTPRMIAKTVVEQIRQVEGVDNTKTLAGAEI